MSLTVTVLVTIRSVFCWFSVNIRFIIVQVKQFHCNCCIVIDDISTELWVYSAMASETWSGFTDEDIKKIKSYPSNSTLCNDSSFKETSMTRNSMTIDEDFSESVQEIKVIAADNINSCCKDKKSQKNKYRYVKPVSSERKTFEHNKTQEVSPEIICDEISVDKSELVLETNNSSINDSGYSNSDLDLNLPSLEIFEIKQKRIEAENARRRALINQAIMDKKKQTQAEAVKLNKITFELNRLDSILSADVAILRDFIEKASIEFSEAEKRYLKAEKEFVEAKLMLFEKMQKKQQLTEHLCAIIEQNENRKANKLVELMKQLEMEVVTEDYKINEIEPILSNLCMLNEETFSCQTLKTSPKPGNNASHEQIFPNELKTECTTTAENTKNNENSYETSKELHLNDRINSS